MFTFSKPCRSEDDLLEWEEHFTKKRLFCIIVEREDGYYELRVQGTDAFELNPVKYKGGEDE